MSKNFTTGKNATENTNTPTLPPSNTTVNASIVSAAPDKPSIHEHADTGSSLKSLFFREVDPKRAYAIYAMKQNPRDFPLRLPVYRDSPDRPGIPEHLTLSEARSPQGFYENQPYLGFIPLDNVFEGPIFSRFHGSRPSLTEYISQLPSGLFIFDPDLAQSWIRVEYALMLIARQLYNPLRPLTAPIPPYPSNTKFYEAKPTLKRVIDSVMFAQKLFIFLIAELRYNVVMNQQVSSSTTWVQVLENSPIGPDIDKVWLSNLSASKAMTTTHLAGYLIDPTPMAEYILKRFRKFYHNHAPIYVILARIDRSNPYKPKFKYTLNQTRLDMLGVFHVTFSECLYYIENVELYMQKQYVTRELPQRRLDVDPPSSVQQHLVLASSPNVSTPYYPSHPNNDLESPVSPIQARENDDLPEPLPYSGQKIGEWWYEFLQDQRMYYNQEIILETCLDHQDRLEREAYGTYYNCCAELPQEFKAIVYAWKPTTLHPTFLLRSPLEMCEVIVYWSQYPSSHRIYDIFNNVWDLYDPSCDMVTLTRTIETTASHISDVEPSAVDAGVEAMTQEAVDNLKISIPDLADDRRKHAKMAKARLKKNGENQFYFENPVEYAQHRYGFVHPHPSFRFNHDTKIKWWLFLGKNLQNENFSHMDTLSLALDCLMQGHSDHIRNLFDLYVHATKLMNATNIAIQRIPDAVFRTVDEENKRNLYLLRFPLSRQNDWVIGVNSAANVVLALREQWTHHRSNLIEKFLKYGIEFLTLRPLEKGDETNPASLVVKHRLPTAPETGQFLISDYEKYERERERLFDSPVGRIAARSGGTVARLWRKNSRRFNERVNDVNRGPSDEGNGVKVYCGESMAFYDDYLPATMDALICGQYLARTDSSVASFPKVSWYKPNHAFNLRRAPYNSRWTEMDEFKFIETEEKILDGQPPQAMGKWKKESSDKLGALDNAYEQHCIAFLDSYIYTKNK